MLAFALGALLLPTEILLDTAAVSPVVVAGEYRPWETETDLEAGEHVEAWVEGWTEERPQGTITRLVVEGPGVPRTEMVNGRPRSRVVPFRRVSHVDRLSPHPGAARIRITPVPLSGRYRFRVERPGSSDRTGALAFRLRAERRAHPTLELDTPVAGALQEGDEVDGNYALGRLDRWTFLGRAGARGVVTLGAESDTDRFTIAVHGPGGNSWFSEPPADPFEPVRLEISGLEDALYTIEVRHRFVVERPYEIRAILF